MSEDTCSFNLNYETGLECSVAGFKPDVLAVMHCPFYPVTETAQLKSLNKHVFTIAYY